MSHSSLDFGQAIETETMVLFWNPPAVYSQWTYSIFSVEDTSYSYAEQFMMAEKARLFGDHKIRAQILDSQDPREQQQLGKKVQNFNNERWVQERLRIVILGNLAKFSQNLEMKQQLLATGDKLLVEASPVDKIWGVGLRADDARIHDRKNWQGLNLLGEALVEVRRQLRAL